MGTHEGGETYSLCLIMQPNKAQPVPAHAESLYLVSLSTAEMELEVLCHVLLISAQQLWCLYPVNFHKNNIHVHMSVCIPFFVYFIINCIARDLTINFEKDSQF